MSPSIKHQNFILHNIKAVETFQDTDTSSDLSQAEPAAVSGVPGRKVSSKTVSPVTSPVPDQMRKTNSQVSISHMSTCSSTRQDSDIPELTYGANPRLVSASAGVDIRTHPDRGRFFVATQDLSPGLPIYIYSAFTF